MADCSTCRFTDRSMWAQPCCDCCSCNRWLPQDLHDRLTKLFLRLFFRWSQTKTARGVRLYLYWNGL